MKNSEKRKDQAYLDEKQMELWYEAICEEIPWA